uniref:Uncharacterized protein n=1 Tax=Lepeophtheirus salmonis TaxID=72036 RepID=A0A0K2U382_LEPSM
MSPSFMWRGGKIIFSRSTSDSLIICLSPGFKFSLGDLSVLTQCWYLLSHKHIKHGYFV